MAKVQITFTHDQIEVLASSMAAAVDTAQQFGVTVSAPDRALYATLLAAHAAVCPSAAVEETVETLSFIAAEHLPVSVIEEMDAAETGTPDHV